LSGILSIPLAICSRAGLATSANFSLLLAASITLETVLPYLPNFPSFARSPTYGMILRADKPAPSQSPLKAEMMLLVPSANGVGSAIPTISRPS